MKKLFLGLLASFLISGCAQLTNLLGEVKTDPAIIGVTGTWIQLGVSSLPIAGGVPLPSLTFGYGTIWRIGITEEAHIRVGSVTGIDQPGTKVEGNASLSIDTKDTSKALEKMADVYSRRSPAPDPVKP